MENEDEELTDAQIDAIADRGHQLIAWQKRRPKHKPPRIAKAVLVIAGNVVFWWFFLWWEEHSFEVWQHAKVLWGWTSR